jgi:hypothetical protein
MKIKHLFLILTLFACSKEDTTATLTGKWKLVKYHNLKLGTSEPEPDDIGRSIIINFSDDGSVGKMDGQTVSNSVRGDYELFEANKMKTVSFGGTKVGEPNWGSSFWVAINVASSYERQNNKLFIYYNAETQKMEFEKQ